jgi:hypothetical protein
MRLFVRGFISRRVTKKVRHKWVLVQIGFPVLVCELGSLAREGSNKRCTQRCRYFVVGVVVGVVVVVVVVVVSVMIDDGDVR